MQFVPNGPSRKERASQGGVCGDINDAPFRPLFSSPARVTLKRAHLGLDDFSNVEGGSVHTPGATPGTSSLHDAQPAPPTAPAAGATVTPLPLDAPPPLRLGLGDVDLESNAVSADDPRNSFSVGTRCGGRVATGESYERRQRGGERGERGRRSSLSPPLAPPVPRTARRAALPGRRCWSRAIGRPFSRFMSWPLARTRRSFTQARGPTVALSPPSGPRPVARSRAPSTSTSSSDGGLYVPLYPWVPREPGSWRRLAQLRRDVNTLYHLRHPRLVSLMGAVWDSKIEPVLVFESMDGGALAPAKKCSCY